MQCETGAIQSARADAARELAGRYHALVVLKGAASELAGPDGAHATNASGNPALAAPGMGDVLTGLVAAFAARLPPFDALRLAVYLHGLAADRAVAAGDGAEGFTASRLIARVAECLNASAAAPDGAPS